MEAAMPSRQILMPGPRGRTVVVDDVRKDAVFLGAIPWRDGNSCGKKIGQETDYVILPNSGRTSTEIPGAGLLS